MKTSRIYRSALWWLIPSAAFAQSKFQVEKIELFNQTSANAPVIGGTVGFPSYYGYIDSSVAATVTIPGFAAATVPFDTDNGDYELDANFSTKAALDAAYPNGSYQMSPTGNPTIVIPVTGDAYPATVPQVIGGTWQNNVLVLNAAQSNTLTFSTFSGYASTAGGQVAAFILFKLQSATSQDNVSLKQEYSTQTLTGITQSSSPFTTYTIPAGTLTPGLVYAAVLEYIVVTNDNFTTIPGAGIFGMYGRNTEFYIAAQAISAPAAPVITQEPTSVSGSLGSNVTLTANYTPASVNGSAPTTSTWFTDGQALEAGSKYTFGLNGNVTINNLAATDAGSYSLHVYNVSGVVLSNSVTVSIGTPPVITAQPSLVSNTLTINGTGGGTTVVLTLAATGATAYQWQVNGANVIQGNASGTTGSTLVLSGASSLNAGNYTCVVSNGSGSVTSNAVTLNVTTTTSPGRLGNLSVLTEAGNGAQPLTVGFEIGGAGTSGQQSLLIRGDGPLLAAQPFNLTGTLADPVIALFLQGSSTPLTSDDNWSTNQTQVTAAEANTFAYPLAAGSLDAALVSSLALGAYSVQVTGNGNGLGQALAEVYDNTTLGGYTVATPRLINLSCLTQVNAGGLLTAGFVVGGTTARTVLIRATGPALAVAPFNFAGTMPDPQLSVHATVNGQDEVLATNAGWAASPQITAIDSLVFAFALTNPNSHDSAVLITLPPGNYSAQVTSANGVAGTALVEVYEVP